MANQVFYYVFLALSGLAIIRGYWVDDETKAAVAFGAGLAFFILAAFLNALHSIRPTVIVNNNYEKGLRTDTDIRDEKS